MCCAEMPVLNAGAQKPRVFGRFPSETCVFPRCGGPPGAEVPCFHAPAGAALRHGETHGFSGVFGGQKIPLFYGRGAQRPQKPRVFADQLPPPFRAPLRRGVRVRDAQRPEKTALSDPETQFCHGAEPSAGRKSPVFPAPPSLRRPLPGRPRADPAGMREGFCTSGPNPPCFAARTGPP